MAASDAAAPAAPASAPGLPLALPQAGSSGYSHIHHPVSTDLPAAQLAAQYREAMRHRVQKHPGDDDARALPAQARAAWKYSDAKIAISDP
jgi:hypothetical protein